MNLKTIELSEDVVDSFQEWINAQVIPDPPDNLREIYEQRVLTELSYLRAEMYDSPEHQKELREIQKRENSDKVPRNIQNPNYTRLISLYHRISKSESIEQVLAILNEIKTFLEGLEVIEQFEYVPAVFNTPIDVRCCQDLSDCFNYFLTRFQSSESSKD